MKLKYLFKRRQFIQHPKSSFRHDLFMRLNEYNSIIAQSAQNAEYFRLAGMKHYSDYTDSLVDKRNVIKDLLMPLTEIHN